MAALDEPSRSAHWPLWLGGLCLAAEGLAWAWLALLPAGASAPAAAAPIGLGLAALLGCAVAARAWWSALAAARREAADARRLLDATLHTLDVGLEVYDEQDRLVLYNKRLTLMHPDLHRPSDIGQAFGPLVRANLERGLITAAIGREEAWLAERLAERGTRSKPLLQELAGDQWINTYEARTPEGYLVAVRVDVTELVRKGRALEESNSQLARQSVTDGLTGIGNRRLFDDTLAAQWQRAVHTGTPLSLLLVDIDHFKAFNDHCGHLAGDAALRRVAQVLDRSVHPARELAARYGGEEFGVLLQDADQAQAVAAGRRIMDALAAEAIAHPASPTGPLLTCSIGVATVVPGAGLDPQALVNAADAALYRAKSEGRARLVAAPDTVAPSPHERGGGEPEALAAP